MAGCGGRADVDRRHPFDRVQCDSTQLSLEVLRFTASIRPQSIPAHGLGTNSLLEERDGIAVGHPGDEVTGGGVDALLLDRAGVEEIVRLLAGLLPEAAEDPGGLS